MVCLGPTALPLLWRLLPNQPVRSCVGVVEVLKHLIDFVIPKFDIRFLEDLQVDWFDHGDQLLIQRGLESVVLLEGFAVAVIGAIGSRNLGAVRPVKSGRVGLVGATNGVSVMVP